MFASFPVFKFKLYPQLPFWIGILLLGTFTAQGQQKQRIILDADTGNEVDDLYAISRALIEPSWEITALNATHWQTSHWAVPQSMENSHRLNQVITGYLGLSVPTKRGGIARMYDWGDQAQHSAAAYEIIRQAREMPEGQKLTVVALGALTNVASAIYIDPSIEFRIDLYWPGTSYDFQNDILKKTDFNCVMDVQALEIILMSEVDMHVIPVNVAQAMQFEFEETAARLRGVHPLGDFLVDRWFQHLDGGRKHRTIWDLALVEAMIHPEWAEKVEVTTSRDNGKRKISYYRSIQAKKMRADFFEKLLAYLQKE